MWKAGFVEPIKFEWASLILFVPKNDESLCFCVAYRFLNSVIVCDSYAIPFMDEFIDFSWRNKAVFYLES